MNRKQMMASHINLMAEIVMAEIRDTEDGNMTRIDLCEMLGLKLNSYPQESETQQETTWLCGILTRRLQDQGRLRYEETSPNRTTYYLT